MNRYASYSNCNFSPFTISRKHIWVGVIVLAVFPKKKTSFATQTVQDKIKTAAYGAQIMHKT